MFPVYCLLPTFGRKTSAQMVLNIEMDRRKDRVSDLICIYNRIYYISHYILYIAYDIYMICYNRCCPCLRGKKKKKDQSNQSETIFTTMNRYLTVSRYIAVLTHSQTLTIRPSPVHL